MAATDPQTGYASVNGLNMFYEFHGSGRPLVLLHGALSTTEVDFGAMLPSLAKTRQVIAVEQQAHGHTDDLDVLLAFYDYPAEHWLHLRTTDESFKGPVALPAGPGAVRLSVGRGRPRSEEQGRGAGSPAAQLCPLEGLNVAPQ